MAINYLTAENLTKSWGEKPLFQNISFGINEGQKIALIARNGIGKTSLLNILVGNDIADEGSVKLRNGLRIGFLNQNPSFDKEKTIQEILFHFENKVVGIIQKYQRTLSLYEENPKKENEDKLNESIQEMDQYEAWDYENKIKEILQQLHLTNLEQKVGTLSGGQLKKLALAAVLIDESDLLVFDEPTNHLDIKTIEWLEDYLDRQKQSILMVTHDRYFLDAVCNEIIEIDNQELYYYRGNYEYFLEKKAERIAREQTEIEKAKNLYRKELEWMRRQPKARATKAKARIDSFYELEKTASKRTEQKKMEFSIRMSRQGKKILEVKNLSKRFDDIVILKDYEYIFNRGEKIGIVGGNGSGKSTFLNLLTGKVSPDSGEIVRGLTTHFGYFTQNTLDVDPKLRVLEIVKEIAEFIEMGKEEQSAAVFLNHFGFNHSLQHSYYKSLSGGEKRKLQLLLTLIRNPNFLILDEPTNDLDIYTLERLEAFLSDFKGCLIIVSHDRYFLDKLSDHIFVFQGDGKIKDFVGSYSDYREIEIIQESLKKKEKRKEKKIVLKEKKTVLKASYKEKKEFEGLEIEIEKLENEKSELLEKMNSGTLSPQEFQADASRYGKIEKILEEKEIRWLELSELM